MVQCLIRSEIIADRTIHNGRTETYLFSRKHIQQIMLMLFCQGDEVGFFVMFADNRQEIFQFARRSEKNLPFAIDDMLLQVHCYRFTYAEVLIVSGTVTLNSSHKLKKWSIAVRAVKMIAEWSRIFTF